MKYLSMFLLLTGCTQQHQTYMYRQEVTIKKGFYKGCSLLIKEDGGPNYYAVSGNIKCVVNDEAYYEYNELVMKSDLL